MFEEVLIEIDGTNDSVILAGKGDVEAMVSNDETIERLLSWWALVCYDNRYFQWVKAIWDTTVDYLTTVITDTSISEGDLLKGKETQTS